MTSQRPDDEFAPDASEDIAPATRVDEAEVRTTEVTSPGPEATSSPISAGMWIALIVSALLLVLLLVFIVQNNVPAEIHYFGFAFTLPLGVTVLLSAIAGVLIAGIIGSVRIFIVNRTYKQLTHRR